MRILASAVILAGVLSVCGAPAAAATAVINVSAVVISNCRPDSTEASGGLVTIHASCTRGTVPAAQALRSLPIPPAAENVRWSFLGAPANDFDKWLLTYNLASATGDHATSAAEPPANAGDQESAEVPYVGPRPD